MTIGQYSWAEYRVYQYLIKNKVQTSKVNDKLNIITSTLNPVAFKAYNGGSELVQLELLRTWICPGDTSFKRVCKSPYQKIEEVL